MWSMLISCEVLEQSVSKPLLVKLLKEVINDGSCPFIEGQTLAVALYGKPSDREAWAYEHPERCSLTDTTRCGRILYDALRCCVAVQRIRRGQDWPKLNEHECVLLYF